MYLWFTDLPSTTAWRMWTTMDKRVSIAYISIIMKIKSCHKRTSTLRWKRWKCQCWHIWRWWWWWCCWGWSMIMLAAVTAAWTGSMSMFDIDDDPDNHDYDWNDDHLTIMVLEMMILFSGWLWRLLELGGNGNRIWGGAIIIITITMIWWKALRTHRKSICTSRVGFHQ